MGSVIVGGIEFQFLDIMMLVMLLGSAIYCFYTCIRLKREGNFFENKFLLPGGCKAEDCTDPAGFFDYIGIRLLLFGIALFVGLGICVVSVILASAKGILWFELVLIVYILAAFVWYILSQRKAARLFW